MTRDQLIKSVQLQAPITAAGLRRRAQHLVEPWEQDDRLMFLEGAELIEKMAKLIGTA